jgi:hypothetical protein
VTSVQLTQRNAVMLTSVFKIQRELDLSGVECVDWRPEARQRNRTGPKVSVDVAHVRVIEEVEGFGDHVQVSVLSYREKLQYAEIDGSRCGREQCVPTEACRTRGLRPSLTVVRFESSKRIHWLAGLHRHNRRHLGVLEDLR